MAGAGLVGGAGLSYYAQSKVNKAAVAQANAIAKDGTIPIGGRTKDGGFWDGQMTVADYEKNLKKKSAITSLIMGLVSAAGVALISGLTLLLKGKLK
jgi:hypothetical protein